MAEFLLILINLFLANFFATIEIWIVLGGSGIQTHNLEHRVFWNSNSQPRARATHRLGSYPITNVDYWKLLSFVYLYLQVFLLKNIFFTWWRCWWSCRRSHRCRRSTRRRRSSPQRSSSSRCLILPPEMKEMKVMFTPIVEKIVFRGFRLITQNVYFWVTLVCFSFWGSWGSCENWVEPKIESPLADSACQT